MGIYIIGFLAHLFFSARVLFQWILSERHKKVVSPSIYWILSLAGSYLLFLYGWLREDFAILLGQLIAYYIYIWNLNQKSDWEKVPFPVRCILLLTPVVVVLYSISEAVVFAARFFNTDVVPLWLILFGSLGQVLFTMRFVYQWHYSRKRHESVLPLGFWLISLLGSGTIVAYALYRRDPVLIVGQSFGIAAYCRNLYILCRSRHS
ncbi:MAG: lipid-A-disaccharide synthase N-terminal domain-containing protein [Culturomica sp.]|jgi:lipid-A-disaccharide synthase-like uncharacterized protein|nr:lipid-A-disaccharide synthase N-terminal domain-containing protein [Culturomica sp.]